MKEIDNQTYQVGAAGILLSPGAGGSDDWGKSVGSKYTYTIELRDTGRYGFVLPARYILKTASEARAAAFAFARVINNVV